MSTIANIIDYIQEFAPLSLAEPWDNVGLLLGDRASSVSRIMTCLTVTVESAAEAVRERDCLVVSHHPILFKGRKSLTTASPEGRMILSMVQANVSVYSPHTAFDNARGGINDMLAQLLGLVDVESLRPSGAGQSYKLAVFLPEGDLHAVADAMFAAGAGHIGKYSQCSFRTPGTGTFFGSDAANPSVGEKGRREEAPEFRLEAICPEACVDEVIAAMIAAHSYEEPAYDVYPLRPSPAQKSRGVTGAGRLGMLKDPLPLAALAEKVRSILPAPALRYVGRPDRLIERVAIVCGAGGDFVTDAVRRRADLLLTGEARFHDCLHAENEDLCLMLPGHYATERPGVEKLAGILKAQFPDLEVWASQQEKDPLHT